MFTRVLELTSKPGKAKDLSNAINEKAVPILKRQAGFMDEIILISDSEPDRILAISFWKTREDADRYSSGQYRNIGEMLRQMLDAEPFVRTFNVHTPGALKAIAGRAA